MTRLGILIAMTFMLSTSITMMSTSETYAHTGTGAGNNKSKCLYKHCDWQKGHGKGTCHQHFKNSAGTASIRKNAARGCKKT